MKTFFLGLLAISSLPAFAYPTLEQIKAEFHIISNETPYEILEGLYYQGNSARIEDLPLYKDQASFKSAYRMLENTGSLPEVMWGIVARPVVPETKSDSLKVGGKLLRLSKSSIRRDIEGAGPLFPGSPSVTTTLVNTASCRTINECDLLQKKVNDLAHFEAVNDALNVSWTNYPCEYNYRVFNKYLLEQTNCTVSGKEIIGYRYGWKE